MQIADIPKFLAKRLGYMPILALASAVSFLKLLIYAGVLELAEFGLLAKLFVLSSAVSAVASAGFHVLANRRVPMLLQKGEEELALFEVLRASVATIALGFIALVLLPPLVAARADLTSLAVLFGLMHGITNNLFLVVTVDLKSRLHLIRYGSTVLTRSLLMVGLGVIAAEYVATGAAVVVAEIAGSFLMIVAVAALYARRVATSMGRDVRGEFWRRIVGSYSEWLPRWRQWREAFVVLLATLIAIVSINLDRWLALDALSAAEFGIYAFAWIAMTAAQSAQQIVAAGFFPVVARGVAQSGVRHGFNTTAFGSGATLLMGTGICFSLTLLAPSIVESWYPEYMGALKVVPYLLAAATLRVSDFWSSFLLIVKEESRLLSYQTATVVAVVLGWLAWCGGLGYEEDGFVKFGMLSVMLAGASYMVSAGLAAARGISR